MEMGNLPGAVELVAGVVMPDDFAVRRIKKRDAVAAEVVRLSSEALGVTLGLHEHILGTEGEFLCFNNSEDPAANAESIVCGSVFRRVLLYGAKSIPAGNFGDVFARRSIVLVPNDLPAGLFEAVVDQTLACQEFGFLEGVLGHKFFCDRRVHDRTGRSNGLNDSRGALVLFLT